MQEISLADIATALGVLIILYKALKMTPKEAKSTDAGIIEKYESSIANQLERNEKLDKIITQLEDSEAEWHKERVELLSTVNDLRMEVSVLKSAVDRLTSQLHSLNITPVVEISGKEK